MNKNENLLTKKDRRRSPKASVSVFSTRKQCILNENACVMVASQMNSEKICEMVRLKYLDNLALSTS